MNPLKWIIAVTFIGLAASASAQTVASNPWVRCTTVQVFGGVASSSPNTHGTFGTAVGWELNHRLEIEGMAAWLAQRRGTQGFAGDMKLFVNLTGPATIVPYLGGGAGLYRGTFDAGRSNVPDFYRRRMQSTPAVRRLSYTDPTAVIAGGAHVYFARHFSIRPEATVRFVMSEAETHAVTAFTFALVYHVEEHASAAKRGTR